MTLPACRNVLVWVSGTEDGQRALELGIELAGRSCGRIGLFGAAPRPSPWIVMPPFAISISPGRLADECLAAVERDVTRAERSVPADIPVTKLVVQASATAGLLTQAHTGCWDTLALGGSPARRGLLHFGPVWRVLRSSPVPVAAVCGSEVVWGGGVEEGGRARVSASESTGSWDTELNDSDAPKEIGVQPSGGLGFAPPGSSVRSMRPGVEGTLR